MKIIVASFLLVILCAQSYAKVTVENNTPYSFKLSLILDLGLKDEEKTIEAGHRVTFTDSEIFPIKKTSGLKIFTDEKNKKKIKEIKWKRTSVGLGSVRVTILSYNPETKEINTRLHKR